MRVLVTGSSGHLGEALVRTLRDLEHEVVGLDILPSPFTTCVGSITDRVTDGPAAARALLSNTPGRSLAVITGLLLAIAFFLLVHRRTDRGDRKLAAARSGPEVARFR